MEPVKLTVKEFDFDTINRVPKNIREYFEKNGVPESYDTLYDAHALEVIGIEGIKKEPDASGKGYGEIPQAQATSGSDISVADLLNLVNGDARKYVPQPTAKFSLSADDSSAPVRGGIYGKDIALAPVREDISQAKSEPSLLEQGLTAIANEKKKASTEPKQATLLEQALTAMGNERKAVPTEQDRMELFKEALSAVSNKGKAVSAEQDKPTLLEQALTAIASARKNIAPAREQGTAVPEMKMAKRDTSESRSAVKVLTDGPKIENKKRGLWSLAQEKVLDNGMVFENLAKKTKNRELEARWNSIRYAKSRAQRLIGNGTNGVSSLNAIREQVEKTGKMKEFYQYLYHKHNVDRMQLEDRYKGSFNKPVFGDTVTADVSQEIVEKYERNNPSFKKIAKQVYSYMNHLRQLMVDNGVISQKTSDTWAEMYPHYVPIQRAGNTELNIDVSPEDTGRTGVNMPIKKATGGSRDILPLFDTMAQRTLQTYNAIAKNRFGVELKNTLGTTIAKKGASVDDVIVSVDMQDDLLQEGKNGRKPTFTVFENGEKVTFEITQEMYDALRPMSEGMAYTNKVANIVSNIRRGLITEYNPTFMLTNAIKDIQDVLLNSQHPAKTYAKIPRAYAELVKKGKWYQEYMENGGEDNTYFDNANVSFNTKHKGLGKALDIPPLSTIRYLNNFIEMAPRLAEYIASREAGRSVEVSMLDAARVTTNFAAGGHLTKLLNRNGATFLNASVQGAMQQVRNVREAKMNGLRGWAGLATKFVLAGLPALLLNGLIWEDDEEYEELSDYVKQNYYIVGKYGDGKFVRIPKGRTVAVIQNAFEQISNAATGNDEVDLNSFLELVINNLAPNNPIDNNILSPILQVATNKTWYGEDLVPARLQDLPAEEQYDESTDAISKWLGEKLDYSPVKINYLLDQYGGGLGDTFLPMLTPEAESGNNSFLGKAFAPLKDKFTTDSVMNNQNVSDFYDLKDRLTVNANDSTATHKDKLMAKYMNAKSAELSELYKQKRNIQNSNLSDSEKYAQVRKVQEQINELAEKASASYTDVQEEPYYAKVSDLRFRWDQDDTDFEGKWVKLSTEQVKRQDKVTKKLRITPNQYWSNMKDEYDYAFDYPQKYAVAKSVGGYEAYKAYSSGLNGIKADKDSNGKSISGSRKDKVFDYIQNLGVDYYTKIILWKSEYTSDDTYNYDIIEYLNSRDDISYDEMVMILRELGLTVDSDGSVTWD